MGDPGFEQVPGTGQEDFFRLGGPQDIMNVNQPATQAQMANLSNLQNMFMQEFGIGQQELDTEGAFNQFLGMAPALAGLIQGPTSQLEELTRERTQRLTNQAVEDVSSKFAGLGSLYSGAARQAAGQAGTAIAGDVAAQLGQQQLGLTGALFQQALPIPFQQQQEQARINAQLAGQRFGQVGSLLGQTIGAQTGLAAPQFMSPYTYASPQFVARGGGVGAGIGAGLSGAGAGAAVGSAFGPIGTGIGAGIGGLTGFFGGLFG